MKNILIVPKVEQKHSEIYLSIDKNWLNFLKKIYKNFNLQIALSSNQKPDLIIFAGGNDLINFNSEKKNLYRHYLNTKFFNYGIRNKIKIIGICAGAQFLAAKYSSKIVKIKKHVGHHQIFFNKKLIKKKYPKASNVNSFHNYGIKNLGVNLQQLAVAKDKTTEFFTHKKLKLVGIMWHPERFKTFRKLDKKIFEDDLWN